MLARHRRLWPTGNLRVVGVGTEHRTLPSFPSLTRLIHPNKSRQEGPNFLMAYVVPCLPVETQIHESHTEYYSDPPVTSYPRSSASQYVCRCTSALVHARHVRHPDQVL